MGLHILYLTLVCLLNLGMSSSSLASPSINMPLQGTVKTIARPARHRTVETPVDATTTGHAIKGENPVTTVRGHVRQSTKVLP